MLFSDLRRALAVAALVFGFAAGAPALAGTVITTTVTGTIFEGTDEAGILFAPGASLAGKGFTLVQRFTPFAKFPSGTASDGNVTAVSNVVVTRLTVDGGSAPFEAVSGFGLFQSGTNPGGAETVVTGSVSGPGGGIDLGGTNFGVVQAVSGIIADATMLQTFSLTGPFVDDDDFPEAFFYAYSNDGVNPVVLLLSFTVQGSDLTLVAVEITQVPEPAGLAVLAIAGAGLLAARRRRPA